jgi:hypothetical protein
MISHQFQILFGIRPQQRESNHGFACRRNFIEKFLLKLVWNGHFASRNFLRGRAIKAKLAVGEMF